MTSYNRNPEGRNGIKNPPSLKDPVFVNALKSYHKEGLCSNKVIKDRLLADHSIETSQGNIFNKRTTLGLHGPRSKKHKMTDQEMEQAVLNQTDKDASGRLGVPTTKNRLAFDQSVQLPRDKVSEIMHRHHPGGFEIRNPAVRHIQRKPVTSIGIHERWSADGHDKLNKIGFGIYAIVDFATSKILGAWLMPNNRLGVAVAHLFLCLVEKYKGLPLQFTTDCGSETTHTYGLANALRDLFNPDLSSDELRAHGYIKSIHNIVSERGWLRMRIEFCDNAVIFFEQGIVDGIYDPDDPEQAELCRWLWAKLLTQELARYVDARNADRSRKVKGKAGPSGVSRNNAFSLHNQYDLDNCLHPLTEEQLDVVREVRQELNGEALLAFNSAEFCLKAEAAYEGLGVTELSFETVWYIFTSMRSCI